MKMLLMVSMMNIGATYHLDILELDTKFDNCRVVFEIGNVQHYKAVKCKELEDKKIEILQWIREIQKSKEYKSLI